jgi:hypothetical protein
MTEYLLSSEAGRAYLPDIPRLFEEGINVPPRLAALFGEHPPRRNLMNLTFRLFHRRLRGVSPGINSRTQTQ